MTAPRRRGPAAAASVAGRRPFDRAVRIAAPLEGALCVALFGVAKAVEGSLNPSPSNALAKAAIVVTFLLVLAVLAFTGYVASRGIWRRVAYRTGATTTDTGLTWMTLFVLTASVVTAVIALRGMVAVSHLIFN